MNTHVELREKIKNRNAYLGDLNKFEGLSNKRGFFYSILGCGVGMTLCAVAILDTSILGLFSLPLGFLLSVFCGVNIMVNASNGNGKKYSPFDFFNSFNSVYFLSDRFWKREKRLSDFNSYEDASTFFENCEPLDESSVVNLLKSIYEFSLEETDLFKECLVYREELGFWPKFLLKMAVEIDKVRLAAVRSEISSLEGLNSNFKGVELDSMAKGKIKIESKVTSINLRNVQNQALG